MSCCCRRRRARLRDRSPARAGTLAARKHSRCPEASGPRCPLRASRRKQSSGVRPVRWSARRGHGNHDTNQRHVAVYGKCGLFSPHPRRQSRGACTVLPCVWPSCNETKDSPIVIAHSTRRRRPASEAPGDIGEGYARADAIVSRHETTRRATNDPSCATGAGEASETGSGAPWTARRWGARTTEVRGVRDSQQTSIRFLLSMCRGVRRRAT